MVIERAREEADEVLIAARARADEKLNHPASIEQTAGDKAEERAREDALLGDERPRPTRLSVKSAAASARILARLLPLERDKTDLYLLTERARSDDALANRDDFLAMVKSRSARSPQRDSAERGVHRRNVHDDEQGQNSLRASQRVQRSAGRMAELISDLVDIASIDGGKLSIVAAESDARSLVAQAVETWGPHAAAKASRGARHAHARDRDDRSRTDPASPRQPDHERLEVQRARHGSRSASPKPRARLVSGSRTAERDPQRQAGPDLR